VGYLTAEAHDGPYIQRYFEAFRTGMRQYDWVEGRNLVLEERFAEGLGGVINTNYATIADLALRARLPPITAGHPYAAAGGLVAYGPSNQKLHARAAYYVDRILRGAKPADLPVEQPATFEWVVNLNTAQALGVTFPPDVAAQVMEWLP
jgi:hypothetical protein